MATDKRQFTLRVQPENFEKLKHIAELERRSISMQVEHMVLTYIESFEKEHGVIVLQAFDSTESEF